MLRQRVHNLLQNVINQRQMGYGGMGYGGMGYGGARKKQVKKVPKRKTFPPTRNAVIKKSCSLRDGLACYNRTNQNKLAQTMVGLRKKLRLCKEKRGRGVIGGNYADMMGRGSLIGGVKKKKTVIKCKKPKNSAWMDHVREYAAHHEISYKDALKEAGPSYRKLHGAGLGTLY